MIKSIKKHYHWILVVVMVILMAVRGGASNNMSSLHLLPVTETLGISRVQFSLACSASYLLAMFSTMFAGPVIQRYGYRPLLVFFFLVSAGAYALMGWANNYLLFFAGYALLGVTVGFCGDSGIARVVSAWFHKHRGTVMGIITASTGLGSSIMCIFQAAAIERTSYRASLYLVAFLMVVCAALALFFVRNHPAKIGLLPYGDGEQITYKKREHDDHWHGLPMKRLVRLPLFYMLIAGTLFSAVLPYLGYYVMVPHLQDKGLSATQASTMQSILMFCLAGAKLITGYLSDKIGARKVQLMCIVCNLAALVLLAVGNDFTVLLLGVIIFAFGLPSFSVMIPLISASLLGYQAQAAYTGILFAMISAASIVASPVSNAIYAKIGNTYSPIFLVAAGLLAVLICTYLVMYRMADKERANLETAETAQQNIL